MSMSEPLVGGGKLVKVHGASGIAVEGVPGARRGLVVTSASSHLDGGVWTAGRYQLTRRVVAGTDLWYVRRLGARPVGGDK